MLRKLVGAIVIVLSAMPLAHAKDCADPEYRAFDFWIGDWQTYDLEDKDPTKSIAHNRVDAILDGCVIREDYDQFDGHHGQSFTIYDARRHVWHQSWVTNRGELLVVEGTRKENHIVLEGDRLTDKGKQRVRVDWHPEGEGVRETSQVSMDGGKTWIQEFDIVFRHEPPKK